MAEPGREVKAPGSLSRASSQTSSSLTPAWLGGSSRHECVSDRYLIKIERESSS